MKILVAGVGSIGSNLVACLASDVRDEHEITVVDYGFIEERNIRVNTQFYFPDEIGATKVDALQFNLHKFLQRKVNILHANIKKETAQNIVSPFGLVVDCLDNFEARSAITGACRTIPCVHIGFSPQMTFSIEWNEGYVAPVNTKDADICEMEGASSFVKMVAALGSLVVMDFLKTGNKRQFTGNRLSIREVK